MKFYRFACACVPLLLSASLTYSQTLASDTLLARFQPGLSSQLYNGPEYATLFTSNQVGHQFYLTNQEQKGSLYYNDGYYPAVRMLYDIYRDQVILSHPATAMRIRLVPEKVSRFTIGKHSFIRINPPPEAGIAPGFYELLLDSTIQVVARRTKRLRESQEKKAIIKNFEANTTLYVYRTGSYHEVTNKKSLVSQLKDKKAELQKYIAANRLRFTKQSQEQDVLTTVRYYLTLNR